MATPPNFVHAASIEFVCTVPECHLYSSTTMKRKTACIGVLSCIHQCGPSGTTGCAKTSKQLLRKKCRKGKHILLRLTPSHDMHLLAKYLCPALPRGACLAAYGFAHGRSRDVLAAMRLTSKSPHFNFDFDDRTGRPIKPLCTVTGMSTVPAHTSIRTHKELSRPCPLRD